MADRAAENRASFFITAFGTVCLGTLLLLLAPIAAAGATVALSYIDAPNRAVALALPYLLFLPALLLGVIGLIMLVIGSVRWAVYGRTSQGPLQQDTQLLDLMRSINRRMLLSETAKRLAYRSEDAEALRQTIRQDMDRGDYDAALVLVDELSNAYGAREEGEHLREEILAARETETEKKVTDALETFERLLQNHDYHNAARQAAKLQRLYPESPRVKGLTQRVAQAKEQYKQDLERRFLQAAENDDVDRAMELLKELDKYLTEQEAEPFRETARGVIGKKRDNLGVQFKLAVRDKEWHQAVEVGEQLLREFPNTRMADEARQMMDTLRQRAANQDRSGSNAQPAPARTTASG